MGQGKEVKTRESPHVEVMERGEIFFFYRPRVNKESVRDVAGVQRLFIVLRPESGEREVEEKRSSDSGQEARFKEAKAAEPKDDNADKNDREGIEKSDKRKKLSGKSTDSEPSGRRERGKKFETDAGSRGKEEAEKRSFQEEHEKLKSPKEEVEADLDKKWGEEKRTRDLDAADERGSEAGKGSEKVDISKQTLLRFIVMGRKSLPDPSRRPQPYWGFVEVVTTDPEDIKKALSAEEYETVTRGPREKPGCRPLGEGIYRLVRHKDGTRVHTHLVYKLELPGPDKPHKPQEAFNIEPEGSYIIQVKNPEHGNPPTVGLPNKRRATYPAHLQGNMGAYRFVSVDPPDFLNYEGCEFILISASDDIEGELGLNLEVECLGDKDKSDLLRLFGGPNEGWGPITPLIEGEWA